MKERLGNGLFEAVDYSRGGGGGGANSSIYGIHVECWLTMSVLIELGNDEPDHLFTYRAGKKSVLAKSLNRSSEHLLAMFDIVIGNTTSCSNYN